MDNDQSSLYDNEVSSSNTSFIDSGCESEASVPCKDALEQGDETALSSSQRQIATEQSSSMALKPLIVERGATAWEVPLFSNWWDIPATNLRPVIAPLNAVDDLVFPEVRHPCRFSRYEKALPPLRSNPEPRPVRIDRISATGSTRSG